MSRSYRFDMLDVSDREFINVQVDDQMRMVHYNAYGYALPVRVGDPLVLASPPGM